MSKYSSVYRLSAAMVALFVWAAPAYSQSVYYVRAGAGGAGNGSDWKNAYTSLPATLQRGATYYVAGGAYPSYTFNTPQSGTSVITVKKASPADHGTEVGWNASYGTSQAVFASQINVYKGYFVLDGQYRDENDWFDGASYGFKIAHNGAWQNLVIRDPNALEPCPNVTIRYLYIAAIVGQLPPATSIRPYAIDTDTYSATLKNKGYVFSHNYVRGSNNPYFLRNLIWPLVQYCASAKTCGNSDFHGEVINLYYASAGGGIIRYNHLKDCYNGASGYPAGGGTGCIGFAYGNGGEVYGNIIENYYVGNGGVAAGWDNSNLKVYNNTFVNGGLNSPTVFFPQPAEGYTGIGNEAFNNLTVGCKVTSYTGVGSFGSNATESASVFVNYGAGDYRLARHTAPGRVLPAPYEVDLAGNPRGMGGVWDQGAYQYCNLKSNPTLSISSAFLEFGTVRTNTSREIALRVQNVGAGILAGTASVAEPFTVISGASYSLGPNQSQLLSVRFRPVAAGHTSQTLILTGGGGAALTVSATGEP